MSVWFTSDTHFGHRNIIKYCKRPFAGLHEILTDAIPPDAVSRMDETIVANWNATVGAGDTIYHLGDFAFYREPARTQALLGRLRGTKILIAGNHDRAEVKQLRGWTGVHDTLEIRLGDRHLVLSHYPFKVWNKVHRGAINLHGHCHGGLPGCGQQHDVGVDSWDYRPVGLETLLAAMARLPAYVPLDHHRADLSREPAAPGLPSLPAQGKPAVV